MFDPAVIIIAICLYVGFLFVLANWAERRCAQGRNPANNPFVYAFSLAIYCTTWTYFGSVGRAATAGMDFIAVYIGPTIAIIFWGTILRRLVRLKNTHRITSIADFIAARYGKSQSLAALTTITVLVGIAPYIALQLKAVITTFGIIAVPGAVHEKWIGAHVGPLVVALMIMFTIIFGIRRLDMTERHHGMVVAVAAESMVKLTTFLLAGVFVTYFLFAGFGDIFSRFAQSPFYSRMFEPRLEWTNLTGYVSSIVLGMSAILFLPRQFHIAVVENSDEAHISTAMWVLPLYMLLITLFVLPIAMGGLLKGLPPDSADTFVLSLPLQYGKPWLVLPIFIGGFSAATSMIMISSITMATMITNHLVLPLINWADGPAFLRRRLLQLRWAAVVVVVVLGYWFEEKLAGSYTLVNMGLISFVAALQFAPTILGGLYWQRGSRSGAFLGLGAGFVLWFYTLLLPSLIKSGWLSVTILETGPWGIAWLKPEQLFGLSGLDALTHAVFWSMWFNIGAYIIGSLWFGQDSEEERVSEAFVNLRLPGALFKAGSKQISSIVLDDKVKKIEDVLQQYFEPQTSQMLVRTCLETIGLHNRKHITVTELAELLGEAENRMAGAIGTALAHKAFKAAGIFNLEEANVLSVAYAQILAEMNLSPEELKRKIDYYQEREALLAMHAVDLEQKIKELQEQIRERRRAEDSQKETEARYRTLLEASPDAVVAYDHQGHTTYVNPAFEKTYGWRREELLGRNIDFVPPNEMRKTQEAINTNLEGRNLIIETQRLTKDGRLLDIQLKTAVLKDSQGEMVGSIVIHRDITETKQAGEEMRHLRNLLQNIIDCMPSVLVGVDPEGRVTQWNRSTEKLTGINASQALGQPLNKVFPRFSIELEKIRQAIAQGRVLHETKIQTRLAGNETHFADVTVYPLVGEGTDGAVVRVDDVTERVRLEEMLIQTEKMMSVGGLAAGMAHEINNPLAGMIQNADVILRRLMGDLAASAKAAEACGTSLEAVQAFMHDRNIPQMLEAIRVSGARAATIVGNMLSFSRKADTQFVPVNLGALMDKTVDLASSEYNLKKKYDFRRIEIIREYDPQLPVVPCEETNIQMVLLNILTNAAQAMALGTVHNMSPRIILRLKRDNGMARIEIEDNGPGMEDAIQSRIFEPFFTTKAVGAGTGLGLSVSYFIVVENHGGSLQVASTPGQGSIFTVRLPLSRESQRI